MCGRYTNTASPDYMAKHFGLLDVPDPVVRRYNVAPTDEIVVAVARDSGLVSRAVRWGLVPWWSRDRRGAARMINARAEDVFDRRAYRELVADARSRCLVLADGYYEWLRAEDPKQPKLPMRFVLAGAGGSAGAGRTADAGGAAPVPFAFAGLTTKWRAGGRGPDQQELRTATILTTTANAIAAPIHSRMPVILAGVEEWSRWIDPALDRDGVRALAQPLAPDRLAVLPASPLVNSVANDGPELWDAAGA